MTLINSRPDLMNLSFSGCGFLCVYHAGVAAAIKEYAPEFLENKILGASAGSIVACGLITGVCISHATSTILKVVTQARSRTVGPLHPEFNLLGIVREELESILPPNAYEMCTGRLVISLTRWSDHENVVVEEYSSNADLIDAIMCSCFIPLYCGISPPKFRGVQYIDGGVSDNQPIYDEHTVTVSPFAGESDICPNDWDSGSILGVDFNGTSIRFTARNMFRLMACLWPRSTEDLSKMCVQGFGDALRFLTKRQLAPCIRCLTIQTAEAANSVTEGRRAPSECFSEFDDTKKVAPPPVRIRKRASSNQLNSSYRTRVESECETCGDSDIPLEEANIQSFFPSIMRKPFEDAVAAERSVFQYVMSFRLVRYASTALGISKFPFDMALAFVKKLVYSPAERAFLTAFFGRLHQYIDMVGVPRWIKLKLQALADFILGEVEKQKGRYTNFTCLVAVSETGNYGACLASTSQDNQEKEIEMSEEAKKEMKMLHERDRRRKGMKKAGKLTPDTSEASLPSADLYDVDSYEHVINFTRNHEALYEFHYMDENHVRRSVGLFTDHHGSNGGAPPSSSSTHHHHSRSIGGCPSRLRHVPEEDEDVASAVSAPGVLFHGGLVESDDKDSGLSGIDSLKKGEGEKCQEAAPSKRDACCSPVHEFDATVVDDNQPSTSGASAAPPAHPQGFQESATFPRRTRGRRFAHLKKTSAASSTPAIMSSDSEGIDGTEKLFVPSRKAWRASSEKDPAGSAPTTMNNDDHTTTA